MAWRYILAFALSLGVIIVWNVLNPPVAPRRGPPPGEAVVLPEKVAPKPADDAASAPPAATEAPAKPESTRPARERREVTVKVGDVYEVVADSRGGGCLSKVFLPEYHESVETQAPYQLIFPPREGPGTLGLAVEDPRKHLNEIPWEENWKLEEVRGAAGEPSVVFENEVGALRVKKTVFPGDPRDIPAEVGRDAPGGPADPPGGATARHVKIRLEFTNTSSEESQLVYRLYGPTAIDTEGLQSPGADIEVGVGSWAASERVYVDVLGTGKISGGAWERGTSVAWIGVSNNYFTSILFPIGPAGPRVRYLEKAFAEAYPDTQSLSQLAREKHGASLEELPPHILSELSGKAYKNVRVGLRSLRQTLKPGETLIHEFGLYVGPRERRDLDPYSRLDFQGVRQYGIFSFLVKFFMWLLGLLKTISLGSWGVAIILLTVVVKVCLHPINRKSQGSMQRFQKKLQKVKPQMDEIKAKFAQNRLKMNQELQKVFKEHGINPGQQMAGCLILFLQLPIWLGLYYSLQYAIGLRQASFLYVDDLTRPDRLFSFGTNVPFLGMYFNLLPVLYVILTVVNQQLQPRPDDPQMRAQFRMMTFMLVFFGFIFYSFPAGFMFYFMTSAALGIIESKIIKAELARDVELASPAAAASGDSRASSTYYPSRPRKPEDASGKKKKER